MAAAINGTPRPIHAKAKRMRRQRSDFSAGARLALRKDPNVSRKAEIGNTW